MEEATDKEQEFVDELLGEKAVFDRWEKSYSRLGRMVYGGEASGSPALCLVVDEAFLLMKRTVLCWPEARTLFQQRLPQFEEFLATF